MDAIFIILLSLFAVYGVFAAVYRGLVCCRDNEEKYLVVKVKNQAEEVEAKIRILMQKYPDCEIVIVDDGLIGETEEIIEKLCMDYTNIKMIKKSEI